MITLKIGTSERRDGNIDAKWIQDQVNSRKRAGEPICVKFHIDGGDVNLRLASRDCNSARGGQPRYFSRKEELIIDNWRQKGFSEKGVSTGMVVSFWEFLKRVCD